MKKLYIYKDKMYEYINTCLTCCMKNTNINSSNHIQNDVDMGMKVSSKECDNNEDNTVQTNNHQISTDNIIHSNNDNDMYENKYKDDNNVNNIDHIDDVHNIEKIDDTDCFVSTFVKYNSNSFQIDDVQTVFKAYSTIFQPIVKLKPGDKLNIYNNKIYVSSNSWSQSMERWYYSQSRQYSMEYIKQLFYEYNHYINRLLEYYKDKESSFHAHLLRRYQLILKDILNINITLITSLIELTQTYKNDSIVNRIYNTIYNDLILRNTDIISRLY
jgi:hypothetical protein